ncbi:MAG: ABC transporter substrate-binding protein [Propionibacteriaceae bacterium]|nr:ABC transporter substrate-binding protein [Propionibacteriaceae bacterium]
METKYRSTLLRRLIGTLSVLAVVSTSLAACSGTPQAAGELKDLRLTFVHSSTLLPTYAAKSLGIYEKNGLNVTIEDETNTTTATSSLGTQFDMVMQTPSGYLGALEQGLPIIAVAGCAVNTNETPNTYVMVKNDSPYQSLADLVGKRIGVIGTVNASTIALQYVAMSQGIDKDAFDFVQTGFADMEDQLAAGNVEAVVPVIPYSALMEKKGYRVISTPVTEASKLAINSDRSTNAFFISNKDWAEANLDIVEAFRKSVQEAIDWIAANHDEAMKITAEMTRIDLDIVKETPLSTFAVELTDNDFMTMVIANEAVGLTQGKQSLEGAILPFK